MDKISIIKSSLSAFIMGIVRNLLVMGTTWLVSRKVVDEATSNQILTFMPILIASISWSLIEKYILAKVNLQKILIALELSPGSTLAHLDEAMRKTSEEKTDETK